MSCWAVPEVSPPCVSIIPKGAVSDNAQEHHHASAVAASKSWRRGAQQRRWSTNHGMRPCSRAILCALFLWRIPTARHPSYSIMGRQEPGLRPAALQGARQHDTLWPLESNHHFVAALAPLAGSICTPNNTTYLRATLRARHLQICGERRTLSQTLAAYPRLRGISHHPQDLHWRDRPPHGALGACCQPPRHGGMRV